MRARPLIVSDQAYTKMIAWVRVPTTALPFVTLIPGNTFITADLTALEALPVGLRRWANFYWNFQIMGTKLSIAPIFASDAVAQPLRLAFVPTNNTETTSPGNAREMAELPYSRFWLYRGPSQSNGQNVSNFISTNKIFGQKSPYSRIREDQTGTFDIINNTIEGPDRLFNWQVAAERSDGGTIEDTDLSLYVKIKYYIRFFNRRNLASDVQ